jgi:para-aminobenzoate synthetase / 4-amino-4-deoxychorismate lyase
VTRRSIKLEEGELPSDRPVMQDIDISKNRVFFPGLNGGTLFADPVEVITTGEIGQVQDKIAQAAQACDQGKYIAGFVSYEAAPAFDSALKVKRTTPDCPPLVWFGVYDRPKKLNPILGDGRPEYSLSDWSVSLPRDEYKSRYQSIREKISQGETYQINLTFDLKARFGGDSFTLFQKLYQNQPTPHSVFLQTDTHEFLSVSPELFFRLDDNIIASQPMKGTAPRGKDPSEDKRLARHLSENEKDRAENIMIVDLLRNDLGKICEPGTVRVDKVFQVEKHPTVWQMTSRVEGRTNAGLVEIFDALFPCGSVTGAPKVRSMQIIDQLELSPRGVYCGAIGWAAPGGDCSFCVPIRTMTINRETSIATYNTGSGITWYSEIEGEYNECLQKTEIIRNLVS